ncbi:MAG: glycine-rich domain-containing protein [Elusimicrobiota bacterium]
MRNNMQVKSVFVICLLLGIANSAFSEDAEVKLNSNDGTTKMIVQDKDAKTVSSFDSAGNLVVMGTATIVGSKFSVGGTTLVVINGNVGISTAVPVATLDVGGTGAIKIPVGTTGERPASPANGMLRVNTTTGRLEYYKDGWVGIGAVSAIGGTVTDVGGYRVHTFTAPGTFTVINGGTVEVLVVAGGGGGSGSDGAGYPGGGGGAGGLIYNAAYNVSVGAISVTVGPGGTGGPMYSDNGTNGSNSVFATLTAIGGGKGAYSSGGTVASGGGSGGGGGIFSGANSSGSAGTSGQGNAGGNGFYSGSYAAGGGGGAGATGGNATGSGGGVGGVGVVYSISGSSVYYAGGGGGGGYSCAPGAGGNGGGGTGNSSGAGASGTANTGGGGGGGVGGGYGGSGIVIIRYPI